MWPGCAPGGHNLGGVLGHGRVALDVDPAEGGNQTLSELERQGLVLPATRLHGTPHGGLHPVYLAPPGTRSRKLGPGVMLRGVGWYVVLPPSRLADGRRWSVFDDRPEVPAPDWLLEPSELTRHSPPDPLEHADDLAFCTCVACLPPEPVDLGSLQANLAAFLEDEPREGPELRRTGRGRRGAS
jgi:hypothetical protein